MKHSHISVLTTALLTGALALSLCRPAWGDPGVPDQAQCSVYWVDLSTNTGTVTACPAGDGPTYMHIHLLDSVGAGVPNWDVSVWYFSPLGLAEVHGSLAHARTGPDGTVEIHPRVGLRSISESDCYFIETVVSVLDAEGENMFAVIWSPSGLESDVGDWRTYDMNADGFVFGGLADPVYCPDPPEWGDLPMFSAVWQTDACRCDFNDDGWVGLEDYAFFCDHAGVGALYLTDEDCNSLEVLTFDFPDSADTLVLSKPVYFNNVAPHELYWHVVESYDWLQFTPTGTYLPPTPCPCGLYPDAQDTVWVSVDPQLIAAGVGTTAYIEMAGTSPYEHGNRLTIHANKVGSYMSTSLGSPFSGTLSMETVPGVDVCEEVWLMNYASGPMWWNVVANGRCDWTGPDPTGGLAYTGVPSEIEFCTDPLPPAGHYSCGFTLLSGDPVHPERPIDVELDVDATGVGEIRVTLLEQNVPNPFNPKTAIAFSVGEQDRVTLRVYDLSGRCVRTLIDEDRAPEHYEALWDARDDRGNMVASGIYYYRLEVGGILQTKKMVLLK